MARPATSEELALLRSENQRSSLYLAILTPSTVFAARVNQTFASNDRIAQVSYDGGSGTLTNVKPGMTMWVGSSLGTYDLGMARIRKTPTSTVFYIGETSEIQWADNLYLTIVDEFSIWPRHLVTDDEGTTFMDFDVAYSDQHSNPDPVPVLGPTAAVLWLTGSSVIFEPDASDSWVADGSISAWSWSAPGASATLNLTTATPTITYNAAGTYRVSCQVTTAGGKTFTGYRYVFVFDVDHRPITEFQLKSCEGDFESGGWHFDVRLFDEAALTDVRDRALCVLFAKDWYGQVEQSIGPLDGYENIIAIGWIEKESLKFHPRLPEVEFRVSGPHSWLKNISSYPFGIEYDGSPSAWTEMPALTVKKGLWHLLHWRCTISQVLDIQLASDTRLAPSVEANGGTLWDQINNVGEMISAKAVCDRYGRLIVEIDTQYISTSNRSTIPVVQEVTKGDWLDEIEVERKTVHQVSFLDVSGVSFDGTTATPLFSRAPGNSPRRFGRIESREKMLFASQTQANELCGLILAQTNNEYPNIPVELRNNRLVDICPHQFLSLSISIDDNPRGITWTSKKILPRRVEISQTEGGLLKTALDCEAETSGPPGITVIPPQAPVTNIVPIPPIAIPPWPIIPPGGGSGYVPPVVPPPFVGNACALNLAEPSNGPVNTWFSGTALPTDNYPLTQWFKFWARGSNASYPTRYILNGTMYARDGSWNWVPIYTADTDNWWNLYLVDSSRNVIATGIKDTYAGGYQRTGTFNLSQGANIHGIELVMSPEGANVWNPASSFNEGFGYGYLLAPGAQSTGATVYSAYARLVGSKGRIVNFYGQSSESGHAMTFLRASGTPPLHTLVIAKATWQSQHMGLAPYVWMNGPFATDWEQFDGDQVTAYYTQEYAGATSIRVGYHNLWPARTPDYDVTVNFEVTLYPQASRKFVVNSLLLLNICDYVEG